jgi:hypothetical protein
MEVTKNALLSAIILINSTCLHAQLGNKKADSIRRYAYTVDTSKTILDSLQLTFDSIRVDVKIFSDKIVTINYFNKSGSEMRIEFFFRYNKLTLIRTSEKSQVFTDLSRFTEFFFENCQLFHELYYKTIRPCMAIDLSLDMEKLYGYNKNINADFLKTYTIELFRIITGSTCLRLSL